MIDYLDDSDGPLLAWDVNVEADMVDLRYNRRRKRSYFAGVTVDAVLIMWHSTDMID